ncbi:hypothetical protein [Arcticibacter tournemirensis]|uniref:hypothetical protein n=1 Tax=Arcticibacter tournemirensis TaxID=699437 RepID=UPI001386CEED|nr:hypothetical protein [Arcticibacter tournemirensis]
MKESILEPKAPHNEVGKCDRIGKLVFITGEFQVKGRLQKKRMMHLYTILFFWRGLFS